MSKENIITQIKKNSNEVYRISEKEYEGYRFIDVRIYYQDRKTQEWKPTTKGISIMPNNVEEIVNGILKAMEVMGFTKEEKKIKKKLDSYCNYSLYLGMNCKNCNTTDFVGTIFYPNLCIPCIIKLGKK